MSIETLVNDCLSLEYKLLNGAARGNLDIADLVNNPLASGIVRIFGYGFEEQLVDLLGGQAGPVCDDRAEFLFVGDE